MRLMLPDNIKDKIILDSIILLKNNNGWRQIHNRLKYKLHLRCIGSIYEPSFKYYYIGRLNVYDYNCVHKDVFFIL